MKIKTIESQSRRDFSAIYVCEHCGHERHGYGYDDDNFHRNVIPSMKCDECGKVSPADFCPMNTKYAADEVV